MNLKDVPAINAQVLVDWTGLFLPSPPSLFSCVCGGVGGGGVNKN